MTAHTLLIGLTLVASLGGSALLIASAFVRRRWVRGGVYCFGLGLLIMHVGNFARTWIENLHDRVWWQAELASLTVADRALPQAQAMLQRITEQVARPLVDWLDWTMLGVAALSAGVALLRPEWVMLPKDRAKIGLDPLPALRFGGAR
jgi:hypothetical protein